MTQLLLRGEWRMANSEWSFRGFVLQRSYQRANHFAQALASPHCDVQVGNGENSDALRQQQMSFQFF
jgi:hypothetical protein